MTSHDCPDCGASRPSRQYGCTSCGRGGDGADGPSRRETYRVTATAAGMTLEAFAKMCKIDLDDPTLDEPIARGGAGGAGGAKTKEPLLPILLEDMATLIHEAVAAVDQDLPDADESVRMAEAMKRLRGRANPVLVREALRLARKNPCS